MVDVNKALQLAATHKPMPPLIQTPWLTVKPNDAAQAAIPDVGSQATSSSANVNESITVEAVQVRLNLDHERLPDLLIELVSPSGTRSVLLNPYNSIVEQSTYVNPITAKGFRNFRLLSNKFYGEKSNGEWKLLITDVSNQKQEIRHVNRVFNFDIARFELKNNTKDGQLIDWSIKVFGH
ncbi:proprotein convertase P-domain-containing protein [Ectopseudomonas mendocina]|uniref:Proprotein convertase P-domain-containing protein n=1 Tax=Ectopseudomonas mendocina TaxID=300 RepID=A0ABZ2RPZ9_ECTME